AEIHAREVVESWSASETGATVITNRNEYHADKIIFCGGAWSAKLLRDLDVKLTVTRQVLGWVTPKDPAMFAMGSVHCWTIEHPGGGLWYGFPMMPENPGFKIALHAKSKNVTDPDQVNRQLTPGDEQTFRDCLSRFIPRADGPLLSMRTCLY